MIREHLLGSEQFNIARCRIECAIRALGVTLSRRIINKHLASIDDAIERRRDIRH